MEVNPLSIILVKSDSKGDRLLFRYPVEAGLPLNKNKNYKNRSNGDNDFESVVGHNHYCLPEEYSPPVAPAPPLLHPPQPHTTNIHKGQLTGFTDEVLSTLFAVKPELCHRKFELKVNDVRFVGHPTLLPFRANKDDGTSSTILINIVFALQALASHSIVKCYHDLSKRLGKALRYEEKRCAFLSEEMKIMIALHDEFTAMDSDNEEALDSDACLSLSSPTRSPFHYILQRSSLAKSLKSVFEDLSNTGIVQVRINEWVLVSFCLPHKAHQFHNRGVIIEPETIDKCLRSLRPYHGMLLLVDPNELLDSIPLDSNPALIRLIMQYSPLKSLQTLAIEADLTLCQVFQLTGHLVYWAKATIIYPLCESNVYVIAPDAQIYINSPLVEKFSQDFPGFCLIQVISMFSLPAPLWFHARAWSGGATLSARCIAWLLQRHLLLQLHTYIQFLPTPIGPPVNGIKEYYCEKHDGPKPNLSDSLLSLNHVSFNNKTNTALSENLSNESINAKSRDIVDIPNYNKIESTRKVIFNHNDFKSKPITKSKSRNVPNRYIKASLNSSYDNSLIFGDITLGSSSDSRPSSPQSSDSADDRCVEIDIVNANPSRDDIMQTDNDSDGKNWVLDSGNSSVTHSDHSNENCDEVNEEDIEPVINKELIFDSDNALNNNNHVQHQIENIDLTLKDFNELKVNNSHIHSSIMDKDKIKNFMNSSNSSSGSNVSENKYYSVTKQFEMGLQPLNSLSNFNLNNSYDVVDASHRNSNNQNGTTEQLTEEMLLADFTTDEKTAIFNIPAAHNPDDLNLMATLYKKGYFNGEQHLEEIMFMENLTRSQILQLLDKFRDVLVTYETEDPAIAMLHTKL